MIPEKRDPEVVDTLVHRALLTGEPVELRDDEKREHDERHAPVRRAIGAVGERVRAGRRRRVDDRPLAARLDDLVELAEHLEHDDDVRAIHWVGTVDRDGKRVEIEGSITVADLRQLVRLAEGRG